MITLAPYATVVERRNNTVVIAGAVLLSALALAALRSPGLGLAVAAAATCGAALWWGARYTRTHLIWLPFALLFVEVLPSISFVDDSLRPVLRYPLLCLFCLPVFPTQWRNSMLSRGGFRLYVLYFALALFSVTYSIAPSYSLGRVVGAVLLFGALYSVAAEIKDAHDVRRLFGVYWMACALLVAMLGVSLVALPSDLTWEAPNQWAHDTVVRFAGILGSPNQVGEITLPTVASGMLFWPSASNRVRILIAASIGTAILFAVMADSRSSLVASAIGVFVFTVDRYRWRAAVCWLLLVALGAGGVSILSSDSLQYISRGDVTTLTGRTDIWHFTIQKIEERPLLGYGYEVEGQIFQDREFPLWEGMWDLGPHIAVHNGYLARALGLGVPSFLLWLFLTLRPLSAVFRGAPDYFKIRDSVLLVAIPVLILNLDESAVSDGRYSVGLILTLIWCLAERSRLFAEEQGRAEPSQAASQEI